jgi:hypothetical protein
MKRDPGKAAPSAVVTAPTVTGVSGAPTPAPAPAPTPAPGAPARWRLALIATLFAGWLLYLLYLVLTLPKPDDGPVLVLSRPQFLAADLDVVAHVESVNGPVMVERVLWPEGVKDVQEGQTIKVLNLADCQPLPRGDGREPRPDFRGPGSYLLPLKRLPDSFKVAETLPSPGYPPFRDNRKQAGPPRIYPATAEALAQQRRARGL